MPKLKASNSSITKKFSDSLNDRGERSEGESCMEKSEKHILQNTSDRVDDSRDQLQDLQEEDPEEEAGGEPEEDPEEESGEEPEEDPEVESGVELEEEEDPEEESGEELEDGPEEESGEELEEDLEEESGVELEEDPEEESGEELKEDPEEDPEIDNKWGEASSNGVPSFSRASLYQSLKKCKQEGMQSQTLESEPARLELKNDTVISVATTNNFGSKEEGSGSKEEGSGTSGKRRCSRWEPQPDGDEIKEDDQNCKRRKTRWSSEESQTKMLGPLQPPGFTEDFVTASDKDPQIQGLEAELLEINRKLQSPLIDDRPAEERSPSPDPIYDELGIRINTREVRIRRKLLQKHRSIISKLIKLNPTFNPPPDYMSQNFVKKLYIPTKEYSEYNFVGLIIGPRGNTQKRMERETGAKILLRGKGSSKTPSRPASEKDDLHVRIEANDEESLDAAVAMVEKLLIPIEEGRNEHKRSQLKELAELNGAHRDDNVCSVCGGHGHRYYACPNLQSTFKMDSFYPGCSNSLSTPRPGKEISDKHLYVGYLPQSVDDNRLSELFSPFGKITEAKVVKVRSTGISKGYGFVKFEDSKDAAVAIAHLNGFKIDGKFLKVRLAGLQPNNGCPGLNPIPQIPGCAAVSTNVTSQTDLPGPLHFMLPEHQSSFDDSSSTNMFSCGVNSEHGDPVKAKALAFTPPGNTLISPHFGYSGNMNFSDQNLFSSNDSTAQFPGDPGNLGNFSPFL